MSRFGTLLRAHRRQCQDPLRGGMLTQERLGELLGEVLGHAGYSGAAISDWERSRSKIDEDDRPVLIALLSVLVACHGLRTVREANELLHAGNYRGLDPTERRTVFPNLAAPCPPAIARPEAAPIEYTDERRKQLILLQKVQRFWIEGVLQNSLAASPPLDLGWENVPGVVELPWEDIIHPTLYQQEGGQTIVEAFDNADRALLIMGDAGSGKTTTLLRLAQALGKRAATTATEPLPVVLNLSSWAADGLALVDWLAAELAAKYQIPRRIGRLWLEDDALALLLDGFDEVPALQRAACARAINAFREEWGLTAIAVTTRTAEYEFCGERLRLGGAIRLLPLTPSQLDQYLRQAGKGLAGLREAIHHHDSLLQLGRTLLFLEIMRVVFTDTDADEVSGQAAADAKVRSQSAAAEPPLIAARERLFNVYEDRMFRLHSPQALYSRQETAQWLSWLAAKMEEHDQTVFLLEDLQPSWLSPGDRRLYFWLNHVISGLAIGLVLWLVLQWARAIIPRFPAVLAPVLAGALNVPQGKAEPLVLVGGSLALALVTGFVHLWQFERKEAASDPRGVWYLRLRGIMVGLLTGGLTIAIMVLAGQPALALSWGLAIGFIYAMVSRYLTGTDYRHDIQPIEAVGWSWRQAGKGLLLSLALAAILEILETALFGYNGIVRTVLFFGVAGFLVGGLTGRRIVEKSAVNQGIRLSLRSALASSLLTALALGALTWLMRTPRTALITAVLTVLVIFPFFGGATVIKHYILRLFLWRRGHMPWRYDRFLEYAARLGQLRRVGGAYTFIHYLLQEHFVGKYQSRK